MSKPVLFYSAECPDTPSFVAELKALNVDYEEIEVQSTLPNLKRFLRLRDNVAVFDEAKAKFGVLPLNEIYFFAPALVTGGAEEIKYVNKGDAAVHQSILFDWG